jgi:membrane protein required for colicin V production
MLFNLIPLVFVAVFMAIGSKKGFVRELMGFVGLCAAVIVTFGILDDIAAEIAGAIDASPLTINIIGFVLVLGLTYAVFKLIAKLLAKLIELQKLGKRDQYGGAIIGALRGWLIAGTVLFVTVLLPLPRAYYSLMDKSMLATSAMHSVQFLYNITDSLHPEWPSFLAQIEGSLTSSASKLVEKEKDRAQKKRRTPEERLEHEASMRRALGRVYYFFGNGEEF